MLTDEQREALRTAGNPATIARRDPAIERAVERIVSEQVEATEKRASDAESIANSMQHFANVAERLERKINDHYAPALARAEAAERALVERLLALTEGWEATSVNDHDKPCDDNDDCALCCARDLRAALARPDIDASLDKCGFEPRDRNDWNPLWEPCARDADHDGDHLVTVHLCPACRGYGVDDDLKPCAECPMGRARSACLDAEAGQ